jgi:hypothetical protein
VALALLARKTPERATAAGINHLPADEVSTFSARTA